MVVPIYDTEVTSVSWTRFSSESPNQTKQQLLAYSFLVPSGLSWCHLRKCRASYSLEEAFSHTQSGYCMHTRVPPLLAISSFRQDATPSSDLRQVTWLFEHLNALEQSPHAAVRLAGSGSPEQQLQLDVLVQRIVQRLLLNERYMLAYSVRTDPPIELPADLWHREIVPFLGEDICSLNAVANTSRGGLAALARQTLLELWHQALLCVHLRSRAAQQQCSEGSRTPAHRLWRIQQQLHQEARRAQLPILGMREQAQALDTVHRLRFAKGLERASQLGRSPLFYQTIPSDQRVEVWQTWLAEHPNRHAVRHLDLRDLGLEQLPPEIGLFPNLRILSLQGNQLSWLPDELSHCEQLEELWMTGNNLRTLPPAVRRLHRLRRLDLSGNALSGGLELDRLPKLQALNLSHNQLTEFSIGRDALGQLSHLSLAFNQLRRITLEPGDWPNLRLLSLIRNQLTQVPVGLSQLSGLQVLSLGGNPIHCIHAEELPPYLQKLILAGIPGLRLAGHFARLYDLQDLSLAQCNLASVPKPLQAMARIEKLNLRDNPGVLLPDWLNESGVLQELDLRGTGHRDSVEWLHDLLMVRVLLDGMDGNAGLPSFMHTDRTPLYHLEQQSLALEDLPFPGAPSAWMPPPLRRRGPRLDLFS
jgi:hypothetical protein